MPEYGDKPITGFIDKDSIYVMCPSKDPKNMAPINLAKASLE